MSFDPTIADKPRIEHPGFQNQGLVFGPIVRACEAAKDDTTKEDATSALWQVIFQAWMSCRRLSPISPQHIYESNLAPDLCLAYLLDKIPGPGITISYVFIVEFKRTKHLGFRDLEDELREYVQKYLDLEMGGKGIHPHQEYSRWAPLVGYRDTIIDGKG
jgi:hypothetical protein